MTVIKYHYPLLSIEYPQKRDTFNVETEIHPEIQIILASTQLCKQHEFFYFEWSITFIYKCNATRGKRQKH